VTFDDEMQAAAERAVRIHDAEEYRRRLSQGLGRPIISAELNGARGIIVGNRWLTSKNWKTFPDFLIQYLQSLFTEEWIKLQEGLPTSDQHPLIRWLDIVKRALRDARPTLAAGVRSAQLTGAARALLSLAYDLYLCAHNATLQDILIKRLRSKTEFEGALYETYVIGWFAKAGFHIQFEDEGDTLRTHCEFTATHNETGKRFSVEAKSINSSSLRAGAGEKPPSIRRKLIEALSKRADHPRMIFIDLNRAERPTADAPPVWERDIHMEVARCEQDLTIGGAPAPPAYVFSTNRGYLHALEGPEWAEFAIADGFKIADFPIGKGCSTILEMHRARNRNIEVYWLLQAGFHYNEIPQTFDGKTAEEAFQTASSKRIRIGDLIRIPLADENDVPALIVDAVVDQGNSNVLATCKTDGQYVQVILPLSEVELAIYKREPDTFFGVVKPTNREMRTPLDWFDFVASSYSTARKETLLDWMKASPNITDLRLLSQEQLAEIYCDRVATSFWKNSEKGKRTQSVAPSSE